MPDLLVASFAPLLWSFQPCFTQPSFHSFWALSCGWILCSGRRWLTPRHSSRPTGPVQALLLVSSLLQPIPLDAR